MRNNGAGTFEDVTEAAGLLSLKPSQTAVWFYFSSRRRHTRWNCDWSSDVCSSDLTRAGPRRARGGAARVQAETRGGGTRPSAMAGRKSVVQGKSVDLGGRRIIK